MARRSTIGRNPFDAVIPANPVVMKPEAEKPAAKQRMTVHVPAELIERARNTCFWTPGLTMAALVEEALEKRIAELERKRGEPFPKRKGELKTGRPIK
jgi:hypothetical protein